MLKVLIDSNVMVSALNFGGKPKDVLELARAKKILNLTSPFILEETHGVLIRKFCWQPEIARDTVDHLKQFSHLVFPKETISVIDYPPDNRILECAAAGQADYIISGDHHLTDLKTFRGIKIVDPATFIALIIDRGEK